VKQWPANKSLSILMAMMKKQQFNLQPLLMFSFVVSAGFQGPHDWESEEMYNLQLEIFKFFTGLRS
jgi:hypothetical protein